MIPTRFIFTLALLFGGTRLFSQSILEAYITEGLQNNQSLLQENLAVQSSQLALAQANGSFMPSVNLQSDYTIADGGRAIRFPVGDLFNPVYATLNQLTETRAFPTNLENVNEQFLPNNFHDTKLRIIQPLFNTDIYFYRKASERLVAVADARRSAYEDELKKEIKVAYFRYLQARESLGIYASNLRVLEALLEFNQLRYEQHQVTKDVVYRAQFQLEELKADQATAEERVTTSQAYFNFILNRSMDAPIVVDSLLMVKATLDYPIDIEEAYRYRPELVQLHSAQQAQHYLLKQAQRSRLPQVTGVLDLGFQGDGYRFDSDQKYYLINFSLSWNLFSGFQNQTQIQRQHLELEKLESQETQLKGQIALQLTQAQKAVLTAYERYNAKRRAEKSAANTFSIMTSRYREGQALLVEFLDAQSSRLSAELEASIAKYQLLAREAELKRALAY